LQFPQHTPWQWGRIEAEWEQADVRHSHDHRAKVGRRTANVITFHGTGFRENPSGALSHAGDARVLVSTLDLWLQAPDDVVWMPQMDDLDWLASFRQPNPTGRIRIGHAPTNRALKGTDVFLTACAALQDEGAPIDVVLIEGMSWVEALRVKGTCDVLFDQTAYGYGGNAIEAWAMNIPVVSDGPDAVKAEIARRFGGPAFISVNGDMKAALELTLSPTYRTLMGKAGRAYAERFHSYQVGAHRLAAIYEAL
jgi:glycosyltransferase involved in cell wall biosynthesis